MLIRSVRSVSVARGEAEVHGGFAAAAAGRSAQRAAGIDGSVHRRAERKVEASAHRRHRGRAATPVAPTMPRVEEHEGLEIEHAIRRPHHGQAQFVSGVDAPVDTRVLRAVAAQFVTLMPRRPPRREGQETFAGHLGETTIATARTSCADRPGEVRAVVRPDRGRRRSCCC